MLKHRWMSGLTLALAMFLSAIFMPAVGIWLMLLLISGLAQLELYALLDRGQIPVFRYLGVLCGWAMITVTFFSMDGVIGPAGTPDSWDNWVLLFSIVAVFLRQFPQKLNPKPLETLGCTLLGILYVPFFLNYITRLAFGWEAPQLMAPVGETGRRLTIYFIVVTKSADIGAYFIGSRFGRHKLFPRISPKKSWEGLAGGIGASILASGIYVGVVGSHFGVLTLHRHDVVVLGILLAVTGMVGDMFESLIKRSSGSKDSSAIIPGMGGILDVLDSLLFGAPVMYLYARLFL